MFGHVFAGPVELVHGGEAVGERFAHLACAGGCEVHIVGAGEPVVRPGHHGALAAHHLVDVPVGGVVAQGDGAQTVDESRQHGVGVELAAAPRAHVGGADEHDGGARTAPAHALELSVDALAVVVQRLVVVYHRHGVAAKLQQDHAHIGLLVAAAQQGVVDEGELVAGGAAQWNVIDGHAVAVVQHDAVDVGEAAHGNLQRGGGGVHQPVAGMYAGQAHLHGAVVLAFTIFEGGGEVAVAVVVEQRDVGELLHAGVGVAVARGGGPEGGAAAHAVALGHEAVVAVGACSVAVGGVQGQVAGGVLAHRERGDGLDDGHHARAAAAEGALEPGADVAGDAVHLDLRVAVVEDAHHLVVGAGLLCAREEAVEEGDIVIGQVEVPGHLGHRLAVLLQGVFQVVEVFQLHGVDFLDFHGGLSVVGQHIVQRREVQFRFADFYPVFREKVAKGS